MTATDRLSLLQFEHLSMSGAAAAQFSIALDELRALRLQDRYEHPAALYLGDIAEAGSREELAAAKGQGLGFAHGLIVAKAIAEQEADELRRVFQNAAERTGARLPA
ncbi:hypothetical protein G7009_02650 [Pseudomonas capeferrum]|uniref:hypothetical protein n=1 Tax=Pseudomonas capeferrum TaxID=1495066 RepID=UPI0015E423E1|nr:hypothetical protein [Pseudomonas capeferrum]MBA1200690.1 hypothetical protein [Pseudomonas capeferrum]